MSEVITVQDLETLKKHEIFEAEVLTGKVGGLAGGVNIDYATNQVTGQVQKTLPAILRDLGFEPAAFDFASGGTLGVNDRDKAVLWPLADGGDGDWYNWEGALPKVVPPASSPASTGGVVDGAWRPVGDLSLREELAASGGANMVGFIQAGTGAVPRTSQDKMREDISARDFGAVGDGITGDSAKLQLMINAFAVGTNLIPALTYYLDADVIISGKAAGAVGIQGAYEIKADGASFTGPGRIIIDSCKRLRLVGFDAPTTDLVLRGCWYSDFSGVRMRDIILCDAAGTQFSSNYWNKFYDCQFQSIVTHPSATQGSNKFDWYSCQFRGDATQGFSSTRAYCFNFYANQDAQSWSFTGCDISYYTTDIIYVDPAAVEDINLKFADCYFDTKIPVALARSKFRLITENCQVANDVHTSAKLSSVTHGSQDGWRGDRGAGYKSWTSYNLIPNGDFHDVLPSYVGANLPVGSANSAVVTGLSGAGINGNYININQALTVSNQVSLRSVPAPFTGRQTEVVVLRNGVPGTKTLRYSMFGIFYDVVLTDTEWSIITLTSGVDIAAGAVSNILLLTNDGTGFSVDVCYAGVLFGEAPPLFLPSARPRQLNAAMTYDAPSLAAGGQTTVNVTVPGAEGGDYCIANVGNAAGLTVTAYIVGADTVQVVLFNGSGAVRDLASTTLRVRVFKNGY